jgi:hypothetical protein
MVPLFHSVCRSQRQAPCRAFLAVMAGALLLPIASGCSRSEGDDFVPVTGTVKLQGQPLSIGSVSFRPDAAKGNKSMHIPYGQIDGEGKYELVTIGRKGAPPGWYKVLVYADENALIDANSSRPPTPRWMMHEKYTGEGTTPLSVEVVATPAPGAYDFEVTK